MPETPPDDSADIVVRDQNGKYQVQMPVLPALEDDQAPPAEGADAEAEKNSGFSLPCSYFQQMGLKMRDW